MSKQKQNPLRNIAESQYGVPGGGDNLVANGIYSVDDIIMPVLTHYGTGGDPRVFASYGQRRAKLSWRRVNRNGWISPKRKQRDDKDTVIQIKYARPKKLNFISFELLRVPQEWTIKYYDHTRKRMVFLSDERGRRVDGSLSGFKNNVLEPRHEKNNSHKWRRYDHDLPTIRTSLIEIHLNREAKNPPILNLNSFFGLPKDTPYSLGVRNLKVKLRINDDDDNDDDDDGTPTPIGTTERPVVTRHTSTNAHDGKPNTFWECGPQGAANSVVPFYIDMRADDGSPTVFDRMKMVPLWTGPSMSVYWSNDEVTTPWKISQNRTDLTRLGDADFIEDEGLSVTSAGDGWNVSNDYMRLDLSTSFMIGLLFTPTDTSTGGTGAGGNRYLWNIERPGDARALSLRFNPSAVGGSSMTGTFEVINTSGSNDTTLFTSSNTYTLDKDSQYGIVLGYNQDNGSSSRQGWHLAFAPQPANNSEITMEESSTNALTRFFPTEFTIGSNIATDLDRPMQGTMSRLWVRMDYFNTRAAHSYLKSPKAFSQGDGDPTQHVNGLYNAVLIAKLMQDTEARIGPGAGFFKNKEWTPIAIDYGLQSSQYQLPQTRAKFLKLEFTQLVPRTYLTEEPRLPITHFPLHVTEWYRSTVRTGQKGPFTLVGGRNYFEAVPGLPTPGDPRRLPDVREALEGRSGNGIPPTIYHSDQSSADYAINADNFDGSAQYRELEFATAPMRFYRKGRHEYETKYVEVEHRAFFVGIKELKVFRNKHTIQFDSREYTETYDDDEYIHSSSGWINIGGAMSAQGMGEQITSKMFPSFSNFETIQMAVLDSGWESGFTDAQIDLGTIAHLVDPQDDAFDGDHDTATTHFDVVTGQYQGARGGNVLQVKKIAGSRAEYGLRSASGEYNGAITGNNPRTSAVVRLQLPLTNNGSYELRIYANGVLAAAKPIKLPVKAWKERQLAYVANNDDDDWQVEVVQTNPSVHEPFIVDMLGIWQNPIKWEVANDLESLGGPTILWGAGASPDISDLVSTATSAPQFHAQDLDVPYEFPQPPISDDSTVQTLTVTWASGTQDISDLASVTTSNSQFHAQDQSLEYILPHSFKLTYDGRKSLSVFWKSGTTEATIINRIQGALLSLGFGADIVTVYQGAAAGSYTIAFAESTSVGLLGTADRNQATVDLVMTEPGGHWNTLLWPLNNPTGYFRFPHHGHRLRVRATALRAGAVVSGWTIVPWYIESSMVMRAPLDYSPPWGVSDQEDLLDTSRKPIFQTWCKFFPQRFSVNLYDYF